MAIKNNWNIKTLSVKATFQLQTVMPVKLPMGEAEKVLGKCTFGLYYSAPSVCTKIKVTYSQSECWDNVTLCCLYN